LIDRPGHLVLAYHGCDISVRNLLLSVGDAHLEASKNPYDWLGDGRYFFEDDWMRALGFAIRAAESPGKKFSSKPISVPSVIGVVLRIHRWLDMGTQEGIAEYMDAHDDLTGRDAHLPTNKAAGKHDTDMILRPMDRKIINHVHARRVSAGLPPYDAVRSHFPQGPELLETSGFRRDTHIQIALRNYACVVSYFGVRQAEVAVPRRRKHSSIL
jgi:hypothetical protein